MSINQFVLPEVDLETHIPEEPEKVTVYLVNGKPKIFNAQAAVSLRSQYRIVGVLVGCLPRNSRQNVHLGLPLQLMPEELSLLLNKGYARLVKEKPSTEEELIRRAQAMDKEKEANFKAQQELFREDRRQETLKQMTRIMEGKKAKLQQLQEANGQEIQVEEISAQVVEAVCLENISVSATPEKHLLLQLHTENPWPQETENAEADWTFPSTDIEKTRCKVFQDLWEKHYYLTSGQKFGGDFLAYPGDPSRFHSFFIVICVEKDQQIPALQIISMGRLGSNVRKTVLLASVDAKGDVQYTSLQWTGLS